MNFIKYSILRLALSVAAFFASYYVGVGFVLAIIFGALIGFAISYLAFPRLHTAAAADFNRLIRRKPKKAEADKDQAYEDQLDETQRAQEA